MSIRPTKTIDLKPYGYDGIIVLAAPNYGKRYACDEAIAMNCVQIDVNGKGKTLPKAGWITIMQTLLYVEQAPFELNVNAFITFVNSLDEMNYGAGEVFVKDLQDAVKTLESEISPFVKLGTQTTENSA